MVDSPTATINLLKPSHGGDVNAWDTPVNGNMDIIDSLTGGIATISLNNSPVTLAAGQFQSGLIVFNSTLTGSVAITFPTSYFKSYEIQNLCSGSSSFIVTLQTTAAGGQIVACPPGEIFEVRNDGTNIKYKNFGGRVGSYYMHAGSSVPAWVTGCTVPPYLYCNGTSFSSATYPALATIMQTTTLPDSRGKGHFNINDGTGLITAANSMDGNTLFNTGGDDRAQNHNHTYTDPGHTHTFTAATVISNGTAGGAANGATSTAGLTTGSHTTGITISQANASQSFMGGNSGNMPPAYMGGITMIRAA